MRRGITPALAATALAAVLSGCGMLPGQSGQQGGGGEERQPLSAASTTPEERATEQAPEQPDAPVERERTIAAREVRSGGAKLVVRITGLKRQGRLAMLTWTVTNEGDTRWQMTSSLGDTPGGLGLTVAGIGLVDPVNGKRYVVARTGDYPKVTCLCSDYDVFTEPDEVLPLNATFAAPPPDVTKINVDLKVLGVFADVPIS
ncbi:hypothetical protein [Streptosporangium saharense]|uniref:DUF4352 domain-containing protein n=1 Tax=Streptosporangium saharense TaxID=1706840 RepID=A0A7W7VN89_9ACTN|nr:hypothetical protein [Streptosporangium saharense]MBB4916602.1 hypothetical protein [Streptosporangium saharense]